MKRFAEVVVRYRVAVLVAAVIAVLGAGIAGGGVASSLSGGGFSDPNAESVKAAEVLADRFGSSPPDMIMVVESPGESVDSPTVAKAGLDLVERIGAEAGVSSVSSYWTLGSPPSLKSDAGDEALVFVTLSGDDGAVLERAGELAKAYRQTEGGIRVTVGGSGPLFSEIQSTIESDLSKSEAIAFPITLVLLVIIFGSLVAAFLPLGVGVFAIVGTFFVLEMLTRLTEVSIFALNLTTALGLGLAIDYALFIVSRFREELAQGWDSRDAAMRTMQTAGRTVLFSAGTVAVSLAAMLVFPLSFLRSFGYAGIAVVALAALGAVVVLPALLAVLGSRIERLRVRKVKVVPEGTGFWHRAATAVMRRPVPIAAAVIGLLVLLGAPFLRVDLAQSDDRVLAPGAPAREVGDALRTDFGAFEAASIDVVAEGGNVDDSAELAATLSRLDSVARVDGPGGSYVGGALVIPAGPASARFATPAGFFVSVVPSVDPSSPAAETLVADIRTLPTTMELAVTGATASLVDTKASLFAALPWALGIIALVTFVVLFLMFGSVLVPAKAVVLNLLSLSATFGALVWIFQEGHLSSLLGFTPTGSLDLTMPILMFCIAFGLSMDYEVFLLSRIKEEHDAGADNVRAVAVGLERTGRIVTAAAVLIAVVFIAFAASSVTMIKMFGVGMTLAVLVDAFLIRSTLVPAFMRLAGDANWWAPRWMRGVYDRFGISESVALSGLAPILEPEPATTA
jgi:RND superfamily putative drug exporter